jgi:hypothetical protein
MASNYVSGKLGGGITADDADDPNNHTLREQLGIRATSLPLSESNGSMPIQRMEAHLKSFESRCISDTESIRTAKSVLSQVGQFLNEIAEDNEKVFDVDVDDLADQDDTVVVLPKCCCPASFQKRHKFTICIPVTFRFVDWEPMFFAQINKGERIPAFCSTHHLRYSFNDL